MPTVVHRPFGSRLLGPGDQQPGRLRVRVQLLLTLLLVSTNVIGAVIVFVLSAFVIPGPAPTSASKVALVVVVPVYVVLAVVIGAVWGTAETLRALRWVVRDTEPTLEERRTALRVPWRLTRIQALLWLTATVLFTTISVVLQPGRALNTGFTVAIAGLVVSSIAYLFTEFAMRPIAARALAGEMPQHPRSVGVRRRMLIFWGLGTGAPVVGLVVVALLALTRGEVTLTRLAVVVLALGAVVLLFGLLVTALNARAVVAPILSVRDALQAVERGRLDVEVPVYDGTELGLLQAGFNQMVQGLREREHLRDLFGRHVGRDVAAAATLRDIELGGESRTVSVLFVDLVGSTTYATEHEPREVVQVLNRFFSVVVEEVNEHHGLVNKFMGDAVLAVFGAPEEMPGHAAAALAAARTMARRLADEIPEIRAGIGVATGEAIAGNVGDESRFEYTVIGDAVNAAARITELAKEVDGGLLAAWESVEAAGEESGEETADEAGRWERHGSATLRGRHSESELAVPSCSPATGRGPASTR